jgi:hypothetical protein
MRGAGIWDLGGPETGTLRGRAFALAVCSERYRFSRRTALLRHIMPSPFFRLYAFAP